METIILQSNTFSNIEHDWERRLRVTIFIVIFFMLSISVGVYLKKRKKM